jgi:hypothetical protein
VLARDGLRNLARGRAVRRRIVVQRVVEVEQDGVDRAHRSLETHQERTQGVRTELENQIFVDDRDVAGDRPFDRVDG